MIGLARIASNDIRGTVREKVTKGISGLFIKRSGIECCLHIFQPSTSFFSANLEAGMRFAQAQPPSGLSLLFLSSQKLNEESSERFNRTSQTFARKERAKSW